MIGRVLVACEYSGTVRDAFAKHGWEAWSCDILPTESPGNHIHGDVNEALQQPWDLLIAHPPCTRLANSGVRWLKERDLYEELADGARFFKHLWCQKIPYVAVENPIPHKYALDLIGCSYTQIIQPWHYGHKESKATCLWLRNLPKLRPTNIVENKGSKMWSLPRTKDRAKIRSKTYKGIAEAMASQWTQYIAKEVKRDLRNNKTI